jgi:hypothetical protein
MNPSAPEAAAATEGEAGLPLQGRSGSFAGGHHHVVVRQASDASFVSREGSESPGPAFMNNSFSTCEQGACGARLRASRACFCWLCVSWKVIPGVAVMLRSAEAPP